MSQIQEQEFDRRIRRLMRKHDKLSHGVVHRVGPDGLITAHPRRRLPLPPLRAIVMILGAGFLFKAYLVYALGVATYDERVATLQSGNAFEQAGAIIMQRDPASEWISDQIARLFP